MIQVLHNGLVCLNLKRACKLLQGPQQLPTSWSIVPDMEIVLSHTLLYLKNLKTIWVTTELQHCAASIWFGILQIGRMVEPAQGRRGRTRPGSGRRCCRTELCSSSRTRSRSWHESFIGQCGAFDLH